MSNLLSPIFLIHTLRIGTVEGASCINLGNNYPTDFKSSQKTTQGFGTVGGDNNSFFGTRSMVDDCDQLDMLNVLQEGLPEWVSQMQQPKEKEVQYTDENESEIIIEAPPFSNQPDEN